MNIKLVTIDLDGTLLNDEHQITMRTKQILAKVQDQGIRIVLATGRGPKSCFPIIDELQLVDPIITHNGAVVLDPRTKEISLEIGYQAEELRPIIHYCRENKIHFDVNTALDMYVEQVPEAAREMYEIFFMEPDVVQDTSVLREQIVKFTLFGAEKQMDRAYEKIIPLFPEWSMIRSGERFIDIIHPQATKGYALRHLLGHYQIKAEEVIAFGNYYNDLDMIQLAGTGIAMANSPEKVKEIADRVTLSNNEDGVAFILEEIFG